MHGQHDGEVLLSELKALQHWMNTKGAAIGGRDRTRLLRDVERQVHLFYTTGSIDQLLCALETFAQFLLENR